MARERQSRPSPANSRGVEHMHIDPAMPEAAELQSLLRAQRSKNVDHAAHEVFNPEGDDSTTVAPKSPGEAYREQQLYAAEHDPGNSLVGENTPLVQQARTNLARQRAIRTGGVMP
jgi:hypothetical protein